MGGYEILRKDRNCNGGGEALYIRNSLSYVNRSNLLPQDVEALCIEIIVKHNCKPFAVLAYYRPPNSNSDDFLNRFESIIQILEMEEKELYVMGDFHYNFLQDNISRSLETVCDLYQLTQLINEPTRITDSSKSLIDIILTNAPNRITGVICLASYT